MYGNYSAKGFTILAFPCNQFASQEPGTNAEILAFAQSKNATFPFFAKSNVNAPMCTGDAAQQCGAQSALCCPTNNDMYTYLTSVLPGTIGWNFEKFLVGRDGVPVSRYATGSDPITIIPDILKLL